MSQTGKLRGPFQVRPVPLAEVGARLVCALAKFEQSISRRLRRSYFVVHQEKLAHLFAVKSFFRTHRAIAKSGGLRRGIGIKSRAIHFSPARPKTHADDFMGIGLPCDDVSAGAFRRAPAGKSSHSKVKASPKEVHGAGFS